MVIENRSGSEDQTMARRGDRVYQRKDGLWEARYVKGYDASGKKKYGSVYGKTCREAKEKRRAAEDNLLLFQTPVGPRNVTVGRLVTEWLYINRQRLKPATWQRYEGFWRNHIEGELGKVSALSCTTIILHEYAMERLEQGLSAVSVNAILVFLHSCFQYGQKQYKLPMPEFVYFPREEKEMRVLSPDEQKQLEAYILQDMDIYKLGVLLTLYTGLRIGELCALRWEDIERDQITVRSTMQRLRKTNGSGSAVVVGPPKTKSSLRTIPLPSFLSQHLEHFRKANGGRGFFLGTPSKPIVEPRVMQYRFEKYMKCLEIKGATYHTLRHTFATRCVDQWDFEIKSLSEILGHSSVVITLKKYVHSSMDLKRRNMDKLRLLS